MNDRVLGFTVFGMSPPLVTNGTESTARVPNPGFVAR